MDIKPRIIFYGTPEFAVPSLEILVKNGYPVVAVVTAPDKPSGRGQKINFSPIKEFALVNGIPVLQPLNLKDQSFLEELKKLRVDLQIVVAFRMMPEQVWKLPKLGTFNLHASLLPQYRGAAPINWAIINGESETGVTTFFRQQEIDTGDILFQEKVNIDQHENFEELHNRLMQIGAGLVLKTVSAIQKGSFKANKQIIKSDAELKSAPKLTRENIKLDIRLLYNEAHNFVRGLSPYPAANAELFNPDSGVSLSVKLYKTEAVEAIHDKVPGYMETDNKNYLKVYFRKGYLEIKELQLAGRKKVPIRDFLNGFKLEGQWQLK